MREGELFFVKFLSSWQAEVSQHHNLSILLLVDSMEEREDTESIQYIGALDLS